MSSKLEKLSYSIRKEHQRKTLNFLLFFLTIFILINLTITFLLFPVKQVSNSMSPDFPEKSLALFSPVMKNIERGDVILINSNNNIDDFSFFQKAADLVVRFFTAQQISLLEKNNNSGYKQKVRRVVGLPGDTIYMRDYVLFVKPAGEKHFLTEFEITNKSYNVTFYVAPGTWDSSIGVKGSFDEITLGSDQYFVLGDNRKSCTDSRIWGPVQSDLFNAKCILCYYPFKNIKLY